MTEEEIQKQIQEIEQIYADFRAKLTQLKKQKHELVDNFVKELENTKLQEIRNIIANS